MEQPEAKTLTEPLSGGARILVLAAAFLGWMFAGVEMSLLPLAARSATIGMMTESATAEPAPGSESGETEARTSSNASVVDKKVVSRWFAIYIAAFLLGAAVGGWVFGWYGDRSGRVRAMGVSILWYSVFTGISYLATDPFQLTALRFVACMGIGGMWPAGVSLVAEAWPDVSRPTIAGLIGTSANVGIALLGLVVRALGEAGLELTPESWRWMMLLGASPLPLGVFVLLVIPESPRWLAARTAIAQRTESTVAEVLRPPLLKVTLVGISLGAIPLLGAWGAQKWVIPWAGEVGAEIGVQSLKANTQTVWAIGAAIGSLCGGWLATLLGRRTTYFCVSLGSMLIAEYIFLSLTPANDLTFMGPVFALGLVSTVFFGWLPLYLPELFPTRVRATGSGISFNSGRVISAAVVLSTIGLVEAVQGSYNRIGTITSFIYVLGMVVILLAPETSGQLEESES